MTFDWIDRDTLNELSIFLYAFRELQKQIMD